MEKAKQVVMNFLKEEEGATAIEYGLIAALLAVGIIVAVEGIRDALNTTFENVSGKLDEANT